MKFDITHSLPDNVKETTPEEIRLSHERQGPLPPADVGGEAVGGEAVGGGGRVLRRYSPDTCGKGNVKFTLQKAERASIN
jgi:hypothetical protein